MNASSVNIWKEEERCCAAIVPSQMRRTVQLVPVWGGLARRAVAAGPQTFPAAKMGLADPSAVVAESQWRDDAMSA